MTCDLILIIMFAFCIYKNEAVLLMLNHVDAWS